jgi:hypothetical protein
MVGVMNALPRQGIPLRPDYGALIADQRRSLYRALAARTLGALRREEPSHIVKRSWPDDARACLLTRAASVPTATGGPLSQTRIGDLLLIAPGSAAAQLFARCMNLDFGGGVFEYKIPYPAAYPVPIFVGEGGAIPVVDGNFGSTTVGPVRKLAFATTISHELAV